MKEEEPNWFSRWEEELPSPEELTPLSQTLITPDLAMAFGIGAGISPPSPRRHVSTSFPLYSLDRQLPDPLPPSRSHSQTPVLEYESPDLGGGGGGGCGGGVGGGPGGVGVGGADDQARTLKRPRLVWTPQLHKRFVDAVAHLGIKNAVPKTIMQLMSVDGLTRENVASHLQKYRLYLKRMQGLSGAGAGGGAGGGGVNGAGAAVSDAATERLFASGPVPQQFLSRGGAADQFAPFVPLQQHHQQQFYHHRQQLGSSPPSVGGFDHGFLGRQPQPGIHRVVGPAPVSAGAGGMVSPVSMSPFAKDFDAGSGGRKELSLFPTNDD